MKTTVIFRKFKEGDVIALFPDMSEGLNLINSYQHIGQHSPAHIELIKELKQATLDEYAPLYAELTKLIGYDMEVIQ